VQPPGENHLDEELESTLIGGMEARAVEIADYSPKWPRRFKLERERLREALGEAAIRIEHIGSTAVPGLGAKPVVDILVTVAVPEDETAYRSELEGLGFELRVSEPGHRAFRMLARDINLHVYADDAKEVTDYLLFRDRLRNDDSDRMLYERTKRELAARGVWRDVNYYADAKSEVVQEILGRATEV
jgi:GrpB-like predicted nucleotidyltransferase (UPF0157 family)